MSSMSAIGIFRQLHRRVHRLPTRVYHIESADGRVATVADRQEKKLVQSKNQGTHLTPTRLLMEAESVKNFGPSDLPKLAPTIRPGFLLAFECAVRV